ncbi:MAG: hypothetical protein ABIU38_03370 [Vicinamibacteraceae bacterium]
MAEWPNLYQIDRISLRGGIGTGLLMALVVASMLEALPALRFPVLGGAAAGLIVGGSWIVSHRRRPLESRTAPLSLGLHDGRRPPPR